MEEETLGQIFLRMEAEEALAGRAEWDYQGYLLMLRMSEKLDHAGWGEEADEMVRAAEEIRRGREVANDRYLKLVQRAA